MDRSEEAPDRVDESVRVEVSRDGVVRLESVWPRGSTRLEIGSRVGEEVRLSYVRDSVRLEDVSLEGVEVRLSYVRDSVRLGVVSLEGAEVRLSYVRDSVRLDPVSLDVDEGRLSVRLEPLSRDDEVDDRPSERLEPESREEEEERLEPLSLLRLLPLSDLLEPLSRLDPESLLPEFRPCAIEFKELPALQTSAKSVTRAMRVVINSVLIAFFI